MSEKNSINYSIKKGIYRHYRGDLYQVLGIAYHSETLEPLVIYQAQYDSEDFGNKAYWVRPLQMFQETIEMNGKTVPRFEWIQD